MLVTSISKMVNSTCNFQTEQSPDFHGPCIPGAKIISVYEQASWVLDAHYCKQTFQGRKYLGGTSRGWMAQCFTVHVRLPLWQHSISPNVP